MESNRVILANEPRLLRGLLERVLCQAPGIQIVGEVTDLSLLPKTVEETRAQWIIVSLWQEGKLSRPLQQLLADHPLLCLMGVAADGSRAKVRCASAWEKTLPGLSLHELIATLRQKTQVMPSTP